MEDIKTILKLMNALYSVSHPYNVKYYLESDKVVCDFTTISGEQPLPTYSYEIFSNYYHYSLYKADKYLPIIKNILKTGSEVRDILNHPLIKVDGEIIKHNGRSIYFSESGKEVMEDFKKMISKEVKFDLSNREQNLIITALDNKIKESMDTATESLLFFFYLTPSKFIINMEGKEVTVTVNDIEDFANNSQVGIEEEVDPAFVAQCINSEIYSQLVDGEQETPEQIYFFNAMNRAGYYSNSKDYVTYDFYLRNEFILEGIGPYTFYSFENTAESRWWVRQLVEYLSKK